MWPLIAAGAGLGLGKYFLHDQPEADKNRRIESAKELGSPWTKIHGQTVASPDLMGNLLSGGYSGAALGLNMDAAGSESELNRARAGLLTPEKEAATSQAKGRSPASFDSSTAGTVPSGISPYKWQLLMRDNAAFGGDGR